MRYGQCCTPCSSVKRAAIGKIRQLPLTCWKQCTNIFSMRSLMLPTSPLRRHCPAETCSPRRSKERQQNRLSKCSPLKNSRCREQSGVPCCHSALPKPVRDSSTTLPRLRMHCRRNAKSRATRGSVFPVLSATSPQIKS